jgi:hypothetical protein
MRMATPDCILLWEPVQVLAGMLLACKVHGGSLLLTYDGAALSAQYRHHLVNRGGGETTSGRQIRLSALLEIAVVKVPVHR